MRISSCPNRISTKHAVISLLILGVFVVGILLPIHQTVKAADGLPSLTCKQDAIEVYNDSGIALEAYTYRAYLNGDPLEFGPLNLGHNGLFTYYFSSTVYGTYNFQVIEPDNTTILTQISCTKAEPTRTPTSTYAPTSTNTPTPRPLYMLNSYFDGFGNAVFTIHNYGDSMIFSNRYILYESGSIVGEESFFLFNGGTKTITVAGDPGNYLLNIIDQHGTIVAHDTLNNIPATPTFTATATPTSTSTTTSTTTSTSTNTSTITSTMTVTPTITKAITPTNNPSGSNPPTHTATPRPWFWIFKKATATPVVVLTPSPMPPSASPDIRATLTPAMVPSAAPENTPNPAPAPETRGVPLTLIIFGGLTVLGLAGFGVSTLAKK
jgi:hypothetical protein